MKKFIFFIFLINGLLLKAQILNPGFEQDTASTGKPDNWNQGFYSTYYIRDTTVPHSGNQAAFIKGFGGQSYTIQGAVLGIFSISGKPTALTGWYKCNLQPGDSLVFNPYLYQTNVNSQNKPFYVFTTTNTAVYKQFSVPFDYTNFQVNSVGTIFVSIYLSGPNKDAGNIFIPQTGTWAMIDDLALEQPTVTTGIAGHEGNGIVSENIYPQPASNYVNLVYNLQETAVCSLALFDVTGKEVETVYAGEKQTPGKYKAEINLGGLMPGIYLARLSVGSEVFVSKIVKQ